MRFVAFAVVACVVGCGGSTAISTLGDVNTAQNAELCRRIFSCCSADMRSEQLPTSVTTESGCRQFFDEETAAAIASDESSQTAGHFQFDAAKATACLAQQKTLSCSDFFSTFASDASRNCLRVATTPLVATGQACTSDFDCQGYCDSTTQQCQPLQADGTACGDDSQCGDSSYCVAVAADCSTAVDSMCSPKKSSGTACCAGAECSSGSCVDDVCASALCGTK